MADEEKNETTDETTAAADQVSDTTAADAGETATEEVSDTSAPTAEAETTATEEVSDTTDEAVADAGAAVSEEVSDTAAAGEGASAAEEVSDTAAAAEGATAAEEVSDTSAGAPAKKPRSGKHVPRSERRTRSKPVREKPAARKPITRTEKPASELGRRQERRGVVVSDKGDKTIVVKVDVIKSHPKYKKVVRRAVRFHAHDEANTAGIGDTVRIVETRPLSKTKRWRLAEVVEKAR
jgi:small subunit ribosomal protein S17